MDTLPGMSRALRVLSTCAAMLVVLASGACGSNFEAQTNQVYQPAIGTNSRVGDVYALNVFVVAGDSRGTLVGALLNKANLPDELLAVEASDDGSPLKTSFSDSGLVLPPDRLVQLAQDRASVSIRGDAVTAGRVIEVTLRFRNAAPVTMEAPIVAPSGPYATITPAE